MGWLGEEHMKKFAIGCLVVVVLFAVAGGIAGYWLYGKAKGYVAQFQTLEKLDRNVTNVAAFAVPANGELTEDMVRRFVAVQERVSDRLGSRVAEMKAKQDAFQKRQETENRAPTASEAIAAVTDMMKLIVEGKTAQVDALNEQRFSVEEYAWVRGQVYRAAGMSVAELSIKNLPQLVQEGGSVTKEVGDAAGEVPARNKELVAPLLPKLKDWAPLAFFGL
jgi:hypothetical protein